MIKYRNKEIPILTLKKGTLLFRYSKNGSLPDLRGIPIDSEHTCLNSNYNVFFHPNPFVGRYMLPQFKKFDTINIYKTLADLKIIMLIKPSVFTRGHRNSKRNFIKNCSNTRKGCFDRKLKSSDPCLSDTIIKKYPEITGMIGFAKKDANVLNIFEKNISASNMKYMHFVEDINGVKSVPEIVLYPLKTRNPKDIIINNSEKLDQAYELVSEFPYNTEKLREFMDKAKYNPETYCYEM
jgi:hypothetical protein